MRVLIVENDVVVNVVDVPDMSWTPPRGTLMPMPDVPKIGKGWRLENGQWTPPDRHKKKTRPTGVTTDRIGEPLPVRVAKLEAKLAKFEGETSKNEQKLED